MSEIRDGIDTATGRLAPPAEVEPLQHALFYQLNAVLLQCLETRQMLDAELPLHAANIGIRLMAVFHEFNQPDPMRVLPNVWNAEQLVNRHLALLYLHKLFQAAISTTKAADKVEPTFIRDGLFVIGSRVQDSLIPMLEGYFETTPTPAGSFH